MKATVATLVERVNEDDDGDDEVDDTDFRVTEDVGDLAKLETVEKVCCSTVALLLLPI